MLVVTGKNNIVTVMSKVSLPSQVNNYNHRQITSRRPFKYSYMRITYIREKLE